MWKRSILSAEECVSLYPALEKEERPFLVYHYEHESEPWELSVATAGERGSEQLSLGGFRIAPEERTGLPDFDSRVEALRLGAGMEEKVFWSRKLSLAGPAGSKQIDRIVGGKCVLKPSSGSRAGQPMDTACLDFAIAAFKDFEADSGILLNTGQDLGHGTLSNGESSLSYLSSRFQGCVIADTAKPTAAGNFYCIQGIAEGLGMELSGAKVVLVGFGNIGRFLSTMLSKAGADISVMDVNPQSLAYATESGFRAFDVSERDNLLKESFDLIAFNAAGGSLSEQVMQSLCASASLKAVTGCENLIFPKGVSEQESEESFRAAQKLFTPTEYCGMFGYLTAVEQYLRKGEDVVPEMIQAAEGIKDSAQSAAKAVSEGDFEQTFRSALRDC